MKKYIITLSLIFLTAISMAQGNTKIKYVLPDSVESIIDSCVKRSANPNTKFYFLLNKDSVYSIVVGRYNKKEEKNILKWVKLSNRCVIVNARLYPLIFDYDLKFAVVDDNNIGEFGNRDDKIKRVRLMLHGITIFFKTDGTIIKIENW